MPEDQALVEWPSQALQRHSPSAALALDSQLAPVVVELMEGGRVVDVLRPPMDDDMVEDELGDVPGRPARLHAPDFVDVVPADPQAPVFPVAGQVP